MHDNAPLNPLKHRFFLPGFFFAIKLPLSSTAGGRSRAYVFVMISLVDFLRNKFIHILCIRGIRAEAEVNGLIYCLVERDSGTQSGLKTRQV